MRNPYTGRVIGGTNGRPQRHGLSVFWVLVLTAVVMFVTPGLFNPWIYFTGGHWHVMPAWQGWGRFAADGREYAVFVRMMPRPSGPPYLSKSLGGDAFLCMPGGERLHLALRGGMAKHLPLDVRGQAIYLEVYRRSVWQPWSSGSYQSAGSPALQLKGTWGDRSIEATGFLSRQRDASTVAAGKEKIPVTVKFEESSEWWEMWPACPSLSSRASVEP
jgi:hypothetical protein